MSFMRVSDDHYPDTWFIGYCSCGAKYATESELIAHLEEVNANVPNV